MSTKPINYWRELQLQQEVSNDIILVFLLFFINKSAIFFRLSSLDTPPSQFSRSFDARPFDIASKKKANEKQGILFAYGRTFYFDLILAVFTLDRGKTKHNLHVLKVGKLLFFLLRLFNFLKGGLTLETSWNFIVVRPLIIKMNGQGVSLDLFWKLSNGKENVRTDAATKLLHSLTNKKVYLLFEKVFLLNFSQNYRNFNNLFRMAQRRAQMTIPVGLR